jgi:hypothetical protein
MRRSDSTFFFLAVAIVVPLALLVSGCPSSESGTKCGPPIMDAGQDQNGSVGQTIILRGSLRLPPEDEEACVTAKDTVTFRWEQVSGPDVTLDGERQLQASFVPQLAGSYSFRCQATYPVSESNPTAQVSQWDTVSIEIEDVACGSPVAEAGENRSLATQAGTPVQVTLNGSASHPANTAGCQSVTLTAYTWSKVSEPAGSNVTLLTPGQVQTDAELTEFGDYVFELLVQDSAGTDAGRVDTATDTVTITLTERSPCEDTLTVKVIDAQTGSEMSGVHVTVVDAGDASHTADTNASGDAAFTGLAAGTRKSITARSDDMVPAMPDAPAGDRPKYEVTSVLDHCSGEITIPLKLTSSGQAAPARGLITGKVPASIFEMLPHSNKCAGDCSNQQDCDDIYNGTHYCETDNSNGCQGQCTPKSLLPFFSLGGGDVSGQMRVAILIPVYALGNFNKFPVGDLFARPPTADAILPGNLASDDTFLNGLAAPLGLDPWGDSCESVSECPNNVDWLCDYDEGKCKDKSPLRNIRMEVPAGQNVRLVLMTGVMNVSMIDLLPVLLPFIDSDGTELDFDVGSMLAAFKARTLHICPITVNITAGQENDISSVLAGITPSSCWNVEYQQKEDAIPLADPTAISPDNTCTTNEECEAIDSGYKCMDDPDNPGSTYCFLPLYRVTILSDDETRLVPSAQGFDPAADGADDRMCSQLPATAQHEVLCEGSSGFPESCEPQVFCDIPISSAETECAMSFGLALTSIDFPVGHATIPEGGRVLIGFDFNRTPLIRQTEPRFLVPSLDLAALAGATVSVTQLFFRNIVTRPDMSYELLPGRTGVSSTSSSNVATMNLPEFVPPPSPSGLADAGLNIKVSFVPDDPEADCGTVTFDHIYAVADYMLLPSAGTHDLPGSTSDTVLQSRSLRGLELGRVDRVMDGDEEQILVDNWWRIYAPPGNASFELPSQVSPFSSGEEVRMTYWGSEFSVPFDYDLFSPNQIIRGQTSEVEDGWQLVVP